MDATLSLASRSRKESGSASSGERTPWRVRVGSPARNIPSDSGGRVSRNSYRGADAIAERLNPDGKSPTSGRESRKPAIER